MDEMRNHVHGQAVIALLALALSLVISAKPDSRKATDHAGDAKEAVIDEGQPKDSRAETVYRFRTPRDPDGMVTKGVLVGPSPIRLPEPVCSPGDCVLSRVTISGVVAQNGEFIDGTIHNAVDRELSKHLVYALSKARFTPAKLDGHAVAFKVQLDLQVPSSFPFLVR